MAVTLTSRQKQALAVVVISGGAAGVRVLRKALKSALKEQQLLVSSAGLDSGNSKRSKSTPKVAVDAVFAARLSKILKICVPGPFSSEAGLIYAQTALLIVRTLLTDWSAQIEGGVGRHIIDGNSTRLRRLMALFCGIAVPAAMVGFQPD